jgi:hypothetical protein
MAANTSIISTNRNNMSLKIPKLSNQEIDDSPRLFMIKKKSLFSENNNGSSSNKSQMNKSVDEVINHQYVKNSLTLTNNGTNNNLMKSTVRKRSSLKETRSSLSSENKTNNNATNLSISHSVRQKSRFNNTNMSMANSHNNNNNKSVASETSLLNVVTNGVRSHENSFVQLNNKLLNRGIQTEHFELSSITTMPKSSSKLNSINSSRVDSTNLLKDNNNKTNSYK